MIYLTNDLINYKLEDTPFYKDLEFNPADFTYKTKDGETKHIFFDGNNNWFKSMDYILMTGHWLYGKNTEFRDRFMDINNKKEFNINYTKVSDVKPMLTTDLFHIFLFGILASGYLKELPDCPVHYLTRPIGDENSYGNYSLQNFLKEEMTRNPKYKRQDGTPYYNYIQKKSAIIPSSTGSSLSQISICPIRLVIPAIRNAATNLSEFANTVFKYCYESNNMELKNFARSFIDESWSPYLKPL